MLSASIAFWTVRDDLAIGQPGCFLCLTRCCLSLHVPAGPPPEVTLIPLLLLVGACGLRSVKQDGDAPGGWFGSDCVLQAGKTVQHLLLSLPLCPSNLTDDALWVW